VIDPILSLIRDLSLTLGWTFQHLNEQPYLVGRAAVRAATEQFESMRFNGEAAPSGGLCGHGIDAAILHLSDRPTRHADQVVMMCWLARHIGVPAIGQVDALYESLLGEEVEEAEDRGAANAEATLGRVSDEISCCEVAASPTDEGRNLTAWSGKTDPRLV
jgi:hypothetical protein